ncbi:MAG: hypothetical protein K5831_10300 [Brevundimonas sp.]|uniref:hypothetical protein n=1 Tax=Brevundimonas sp. TaxID=1871086 RepID=UPI002582BF34|nr:hypothetical protein [Brevundimonas sp.]MCV0415257.1 hypothetical protein [Brevundimonas sp.]
MTAQNTEPGATEHQALATAIALGLCFGLLLGIVIDNVGLGLALGPILGIIYHLVSRERATSANDMRPYKDDGIFQLRLHASRVGSGFWRRASDGS